MRPRGNGAGGAPAAGRVGSARPTVLLTTEGTFPHMPGGVGTWCESLIRGLPEVDFVVWALSPSPFLAPRRSLPSNVVRLIDLPLWDTDDPGRVRRARRDAHAAPRDGESGARRSPGEAAAVTRRPSSRDLEREFVPLLRAFLAATAGPEFDSFRFAALLVEMRDHFRRWDYRRTWRSRAAWEVFREHMLSRASLSPGDTLDADAERALHEERAARAAVRGDEPTIGEATEALRWLVRALAPLGVEIPSDIDLVHSSAAGLCALPGILAKTERNTPLFLTEHSLYAREHFLAMHRMHSPFHLKRFTADLVGAVARTAYHLADRIAPVSRYNAQWEMAYGAPRSRIGVIHNGVDEHRFAPADLPRSRRPTVVQVSRIDPLKDQVTLLRVADLVRREIPDVLFLHFGEVGDRDYWAQIRRMHRDRMLEDTVRFMGPTDDVPGCLNHGDVALVTSSSEAFPFAVLEALMCGVPVVTTAVGGIEEAMNGAGVTAPPGDPDALANGVAAILRVDPEQRARMATAARHHALSRFRLSTFLDSYRDWYEALTGIELRPVLVEPEEGVAGEAFKEVPGAVSVEASVPRGVSVMVPRAEEEPVPEAEPEPVPEAIVAADAEPEAEPAGVGSVPLPSVEEWIAAAWAAAEERAAGERRPVELGEVEEPSGRLHAVPALGTMAQPEPEPAVTGAEPEPEPEPAAESRPELEPALAGAVAAQPGAQSVAAFGPSDLEAGLAHPDPFMRADAVSRVSDPAAAEVLARALADEYPQVRREAVRALGRVNGPRAGGFLADAVAHDPSAEVREEAVAALAALLTGPRSAEHEA